MNILHPIKNLKRVVINHLINEALEDVPNLKQAGLNYLDTHKEEFLEFVFAKIKCAVKEFIVKKLDKAKARIVKQTESIN